jgi:hypothetical protein
MPKWTPAIKDTRPTASTDSIAYIVSYGPSVSFQEYTELKQQAKVSKPNVFSSADLKTKGGKQVYAFVEKQPAYPGGDKALKAYLAQKLKNLQESRQLKAGELIILNIVVNEKGIAEDIIATKPQKGTPSSEETLALTTKEVTNIINEMPQWAPGRQNGKPVAVCHTLPIRF